MKRRRARNRSVASDEDDGKRATSPETRSRKSKRDASNTTPARPSRLQPSEPLHMTTRARAATHSTNTSVVSGDSRRSSLAQISPQDQIPFLDVTEDHQRKRKRASSNIDDPAEELSDSPDPTEKGDLYDLEMAQPSSHDSRDSKRVKCTPNGTGNRDVPDVKEEKSDDDDGLAEDLTFEEPRAQLKRKRQTGSSENSFDQQSDHKDSEINHTEVHSPDISSESKRRRRDLGTPEDVKTNDDINEVVLRPDADTPEQSIETFPPTTRAATEIKHSPDERTTTSTGSSSATTPVLGPVDDDLELDDGLALPMVGEELTKPSKRLPGRRRAPHPDPGIEADLRRQLQLRMAYRSVAKALKPILAELADRSINAIDQNPEAHKESYQYDEVMEDLDDTLDERLALLERRYQILREYEEHNRDAEEDLLRRMFSGRICDLKEDYILRCQHQLLELSRKIEEQYDSDLTEDEDGIIPRRQGVKYPFVHTGPLSPKYDSRSRMFIETEKLVDQAVARYSSEGSRRGFMHQHSNEFEDSIADIATAFGVLNKEQRDFATAVLNTNQLVEAAEELERNASQNLHPVIPNEQATALQLLAAASEDVANTSMERERIQTVKTEEFSPRPAEQTLPKPSNFIKSEAIGESDSNYSKRSISILANAAAQSSAANELHYSGPAFITNTTPLAPYLSRQKTPEESHSAISMTASLEIGPDISIPREDTLRYQAERSPSHSLHKTTVINHPIARTSSSRILDLLNEEQPKDPPGIVASSSPASPSSSTRDIPQVKRDLHNGLLLSVYGTGAKGADALSDDQSRSFLDVHTEDNMARATASGPIDAQSLRTASLTPGNSDPVPPNRRHFNNSFWSTVASPEEHLTSRDSGPTQTPIDRVRNMMRQQISGGPVATDSSTPRRSSGSLSAISPSSAPKALSETPPTKHITQFGGTAQPVDSLSSLNALSSDGSSARNAQSTQQSFPTTYSSRRDGVSSGSPRLQYTMPPLSSITQGITLQTGSSWASQGPIYGTSPSMPTTGFPPSNGLLPVPSSSTGEASNAPVPIDPAISSQSGQTLPFQGYGQPPYGQSYTQAAPQYHPHYQGSSYQPPQTYGSSFPGHYGPYHNQTPSFRPSLPALQGVTGTSRASTSSSQAPSPVSEMSTPPNMAGSSRSGPQNSHQRSSSVSASRPGTSQASRPPSTSVPAGYNGTQFGKQLLPANPDPRSPQPSLPLPAGPAQPQQPPKPLGPIMMEKELPKKRHRQYSHIPGTVFRGYTGPKPNR